MTTRYCISYFCKKPLETSAADDALIELDYHITLICQECWEANWATRFSNGRRMYAELISTNQYVIAYFNFRSYADSTLEKRVDKYLADYRKLYELNPANRNPGG